METKIITIKSFEKTNGKKKDQTEWHRISIKATDGKFYSTFSQIPAEALREGAELKVLVSQSQITNTYDIKKVITYTTPRSPQSGEISKSVPPAYFDEAEDYARNQLKKQKGEAIKEPDSLSVQIEQSDSYARELTRRARKIAQDETPEWEGMSEYPYIIAVLIQTMHGKISGDRIALQEAEKLKAYGNKKW